MNKLETKNGYIYGGWREPKNIWRNLTTSIHDDSVAQKVGMRGGTIPGTIHLSLFPPVMLEVFGSRWFERGTVSMYYTYATTDMEKVRAIISVPPEDKNDVQVEARVEMVNEQIVAKGTVSVGEPKETSYLQSLKFVDSDPNELRILKGFKTGDALKEHEVFVTQEQATKGLNAITDHLDYYVKSTPWGSTILSPTAISRVMALAYNLLDAKTLKAVPFYGATEIRYINGPVKVGERYIASGNLICVGASPKTEYFWYDSYLEEKKSGKRVAMMRHMNRFMKSGSPLYQT